MKAGKTCDNKQVQKKSAEEKRKFFESINLYAVRQSRMSLQRNERRKSLKKRLARFRMSRPPKRQSLRQRNIPPLETFDSERRIGERVLRSKGLKASRYLLLSRKKMIRKKKAQQKQKTLTNSVLTLPAKPRDEISTDIDETPISLNETVLKEEKKENQELISSLSPLLTSTSSLSLYPAINSTSSNDHVSTGQLNSTNVFQAARTEQNWVHSETKSFMEGMNNTSSESVDYIKQEDLDASLIFGKLLASYLRRIIPNRQIQAQQEILKVVQSYIE